MIEAEVLETVGKIAGIGGLALGVMLLLFRDLIRKSIFPTLKKDDAYRLLRLITVLVWSVAIARDRRMALGGGRHGNGRRYLHRWSLQPGDRRHGRERDCQFGLPGRRGRSEPMRWGFRRPGLPIFLAFLIAAEVSAAQLRTTGGLQSDRDGCRGER